ncbi:hypothetical protein TgHK011_003733 [Trichoderma gracile]|nr:hypothetical protein TgHK011_003733 [Trichoderma gracile]
MHPASISTTTWASAINNSSVLRAIEERPLQRLADMGIKRNDSHHSRGWPGHMLDRPGLGNRIVFLHTGQDRTTLDSTRSLLSGFAAKEIIMPVKDYKLDLGMLAASRAYSQILIDTRRVRPRWLSVGRGPLLLLMLLQGQQLEQGLKQELEHPTGDLAILATGHFGGRILEAAQSASCFSSRSTSHPQLHLALKHCYTDTTVLRQIPPLLQV